MVSMIDINLTLQIALFCGGVSEGGSHVALPHNHNFIVKIIIGFHKINLFHWFGWRSNTWKNPLSPKSGARCHNSKNRLKYYINIQFISVLEMLFPLLSLAHGSCMHLYCCNIRYLITNFYRPLSYNLMPSLVLKSGPNYVTEVDLRSWTTDTYFLCLLNRALMW